MASDRKQRFATARDLAAALAQFGGVSLDATMEGPAPVMVRTGSASAHSADLGPTMPGGQAISVAAGRETQEELQSRRHRRRGGGRGDRRRSRSAQPHAFACSRSSQRSGRNHSAGRCTGPFASTHARRTRGDRCSGRERQRSAERRTGSSRREEPPTRRATGRPYASTARSHASSGSSRDQDLDPRRPEGSRERQPLRNKALR